MISVLKMKKDRFVQRITVKDDYIVYFGSGQ